MYIRTKIAVCNGMLVDIVTCVTPQGCVLTCLNQWPLTPSSYSDSAGDKHFPTAEFIGLKLAGQLVICCMSTGRVWPHYSLCSLLIVCFSVRLCTTGMLAHEVFKSLLLNWTVSMLLVMRYPRTSLWKTAKKTAQWEHTVPCYWYPCQCWIFLGFYQYFSVKTTPETLFETRNGT